MKLRRPSTEPAHESLAPPENPIDARTPGARLTLRLPDTVGASPLARAAVDVVGFELSDFARENAQLVVSELVTNALEHGGGETRLLLEARGDRRIVGEIVDEGDGFTPPPMRLPAASAQRGRGLWLVSSLAERWGVKEGTTRVWFQMPADPEPSAG